MAVAQVYWEKDGEERENESNERERRKRGGHGVQGLLQRGLLGLKAASKRWGMAARCRTRRCYLLEEEERSFSFVENPLGFGRFQ
jgi:hypothetical protein